MNAQSLATRVPAHRGWIDQCRDETETMAMSCSEYPVIGDESSCTPGWIDQCQDETETMTMSCSEYPVIGDESSCMRTKAG